MPGRLRSVLLTGQLLKLGDCIEVRAVFEDVVRLQGYGIGIRSSDNVSISVPTSEFINPRLVNWIAKDRSHNFSAHEYVYGSNRKEDGMWTIRPAQNL